MDLDRDLLQRAKGRDRSEATEDPGRRTNTDRMRPTAAGATNGLYPRTSPLAGKSGEPEIAPVTFQLDRSDDDKKAQKKREKGAPEKKDPAKTKSPSVQKAADPSKDAKDAPGVKDAHATSAKDAHGNTKPAGATDAHAATASGRGEAHVGGRGGRSGASGSSAASDRNATPGPATAGSVTIQTVSSLATTRDRTDVAIGEEVDFHATSPGSWTASASSDTASGTGNTFRWKAPDHAAGVVTITFTPTGGGAAETKRMRVIGPSVTFTKTSDDPQPPAGVGMWTNLMFGPQTVDFYNVEWLEEPGDPQNVDGYFEQLRLQEGRPLTHRPNEKWTPMSEAGAVNNDVDDHAFINSLPPLTRHVTDLFGARSYFPGSFHWTVPNKYRLKGQGGDGNQFASVTQSFSIDASGTATVSKGGQSATQASDGVAAEQGMVLPRFTTVDEAIAGLRHGGNAAGRLILGLQKLSTYRTRDHESYNLLVAALNSFSNVKLYVAVRNLNTYSVWGADDFTMTISGTQTYTPEPFSVNTDKMHDFNVGWMSIINPNVFASTGTIRFHLSINSGDHELDASMPLPFSEYGSGVILPGSDNRIKLTSFFKVV